MLFGSVSDDKLEYLIILDSKKDDIIVKCQVEIEEMYAS